MAYNLNDHEFVNVNDADNYGHMVHEITNAFRSSETLLKKINTIEVMKVLSIAKREELFSSLLLESANDLK